MCRTCCFYAVSFLAITLAVVPAVAQERAAPPPAPPGAPQPVPGLERLEQLRLQHMREALQLDEKQMQALRGSMEEARRAQRQAMEEHREAMERLQKELRSGSADEDAVRDALQALEGERRTMERLREDHRLQMERLFTPEQRAKFLLFNHRFDERLRELMAKRRGAIGAAPRGRQGFRGAPGRGQPGMRAPLDPRFQPPGETDPARLRQRIQELERMQQELQRRLEEIEKDSG